MIPPGKTIGVLGGGENARMFAHAAARLGYRVHVYAPEPGSIAGAIAHEETNAAYEDGAALMAFARSCEVVTCESVDVPVEALRAVEGLTPLRPSPGVIEICQEDARQTAWLLANKFPSARGVDQAGAEWGGEISVVVARSAKAALRVFPLAENLREGGVLKFVVVPARVPAEVRAAAEKIARFIAEKINLVGVLGVEFFVTKDGQVLVNELAPRTHNSGHWTIDACVTSQFEQQVRAVCGLPLGAVEMTAPAVVMVNILGDAWSTREPDWNTLLAQPQVKLHLYGKTEPRPGRKMGHVTQVHAQVHKEVEKSDK